MQTLPRIMVGQSTKAFLGYRESVDWLDRVVTALSDDPRRGEGVFVCVPAPLLAVFAEPLASVGALVGVQDLSKFPLGPYTGEVAAELVAAMGARLVMVGHPERFKHLGETLDDVRIKCGRAAANGIAPILIAGEPTADTEVEVVIQAQLDAAFADVPPEAPIMVAYEPTWAIGAPQPAPGEHIVDVVSRIRAMAGDRPGGIRIVYGGSAGKGTFADIVRAARELGRPDGVPDGVFLGRAGLDPDVFLQTITEVRDNT